MREKKGKKMGLFGNKFNKLKRDDVVNAICELETQETNLENGIVEKGKQIDELMEKGRVEKNRDIKLFYARKINNLKDEKESDAKRAMYLLYNIKLMRRLKDAIDDKEFVAKTSGIKLNTLLSDQKSLAKFLNKALDSKTRAEDILTDADEVFSEVQSAYDPNQAIYGVNERDDALLAMFETADALVMENEMSDAESGASPRAKEGGSL